MKSLLFAMCLGLVVLASDVLAGEQCPVGGCQVQASQACGRSCGQRVRRVTRVRHRCRHC